MREVIFHDSSVVWSIQYYPDKNILITTFKNGDTYIHGSVGWPVFLKLVGSSSVGQEFNFSVRGRYPSRKELDS